jgi:branched-subunit amino acid transport protein AzlD
MMSLPKALLSILIMALLTFLTRAFPFIFFSKNKPPTLLLLVERAIPPMVILILVLYTLKDIAWSQAPYGIPEVICMVLVGILHAWKKNPLLSIFGGTGIYMILVQTDVLSRLFDAL